MTTNRYKFKPRLPFLLNLEGDYGDFILSCRHKDILRCSVTKHFRSCYAPDGAFKELPFNMCCMANIAIIGKKDKAGDFIWRAFISYTGWEPIITIYKFYGNYEYGIQDIVRKTLLNKSNELKMVNFSSCDFY
jgi:hypothetical protein